MDNEFEQVERITNKEGGAREPIYFESVLVHETEPSSTLYNIRCMMRLLGSKELSGCEFSEEAEVGFGLIMHQIELALDDHGERYDFAEKERIEPAA